MSDLKGSDEVRRNLERLMKGILPEAGRALATEAKPIEQESRGRTPVESGAARDSHRISEPEIRGGAVSVAIVAGDASTPYIVFLHENMEASHVTGQAKFLQSSAFDAKSGLPAKLGKQINLRRAMR